MGFGSLPIWSSWSYSRENGPLRSNTSTSSSHHAKMWGVDYAIFGIIQNAMSCSITRWNVTIFWRADFVSYHFKSKSCFFINIYFHQTQSDRANRYHWTLPPLKNIVPYFICFASIIKAKEAFFNKKMRSFLITCIRLLWIPQQNPSKIFKGLLDSTTGRRRNNFRKTIWDKWQKCNSY